MATMLRAALAATMTVFCTVNALAQPTEPPASTPPAIETLEVTIALMPAGATLPDAVTRVIELPAATAEAARENAARGLDNSNAAREGRGNPEAATEAAERGRERAQENRENAGRGRADGTGGPPGPPDGAGPPGQPPGPPEGRGRPEN